MRVECILFLRSLLIYSEKEKHLIVQDLRGKIAFYFRAVVILSIDAIRATIYMKIIAGSQLDICCEYTATM